MSPVRVGLMLRHVTDPGGITVFTRNVVPEILQADGIEFHLLYRTAAQRDAFGDANGERVVLRARNKLFWDQVAVPRYARRAALDVVFNCKLSVPLLFGGKTAFFLHGLEQFAVPEVFPTMDRLHTRTAMPLYTRKADAVATSTETGRRHMIEYLGVDERKIHVVPLGVHSWLAPASPEKVDALRRRYDLPERYLLFLGGITPLKNVGNLLRALKLLGRSPDLDIPLVLAGFKRWKYKDDFELIDKLGVAGRVHQVGFVADEQLAPLYTGAACFVLPSWYEGFGIPILEAMACGCPVVTSTRGACPEVAGGAALLADPADPEDIAAKIATVLCNPAARDELIHRGLERASRFDWNDTGVGVRRLLEGLC